MSKDKDNELLSFDWDDDTDFSFGGTPEVGDINNSKPAKTDDEDEDEPEKEDEEGAFFDIEKDDTETGKDIDTPSGPVSIYKDLYEDLRENKIFKHVELEEGAELDAETFLELQQEEIETEITQRLEAWANDELDDDAKAFIKFKKDGGKTSDFFKTFKETTEIELGDIEEEDYQDEVIRYQLAKEGWDQEEIEDRLESLTSRGTKEKFAKKYFQKIETELESKKESLVQAQAAQKATAKKQEQDFKNNIQETLTGLKEVKGLRFSEQEKGEILAFLTKKNEKIDDTTSVTGFQKGLSDVFKDPNKLVLLANLIKSDFDFTKIKKGAITEKTKEVKTRIEQRQTIKPFGSGSSPRGSLSDLFDK